MLDDQIDQIDDVAREMTAGSPADGFLRRVAGRVADAGRPRTRRSWRPVHVLVPLSAAAVIVIAVIVMSSRPGDVRPKPDATSIATDVRLGPDATKALPDVRLKPDATKGLPVATSVATTSPGIEGFESLVPAPIVVERLPLAALGRADAIELNPISINPIEIAAMP
jgi:hypothetical protein